MATSGNKHVSLGSSFALYIWWELKSQDIAACTSQVELWWGIKKVAANNSTYNMSASGTAKANGTTYANAVTGWWDMRSASVGSNQYYCHKTITVQHDLTTGAKSFTMSGSFNPGNVNGATSGSVSMTVTLPTIPRMTTPVLSTGSAVMGAGISISLAGRAASTFTHTLSYKLPNGSGGVIAERTAATSVPWTVPQFAEQLPNAVTGSVQISCVTYDGAGSALGTKTVTLTASVPAEAVPVIGSVTVTETVEGLAERYGAFVQNKSRPAVTISAAGVQGSTVASITSTLDGRTYTGGSWTAAAALSAAGALEIRTTVTDSRGRTASLSTAISVLAYTPPVITRFTAVRCGAGGSPADDGNFALLRYAYSVPALNGGNTAEMTVKAKRPAEETYQLELLTGAELEAETSAVSGQEVSASYGWDIQMSVRDSFGAVTTATVQLPSAEVIMDFKADGQGMAIGKTSEQEGLDVNWPVLFRKPMRFESADVIRDILLAAHPVGSYYWSSNATSPAALFGGTWEQVKDRFILAAGDSYAAGATGGVATHLHGAGSYAVPMAASGNSLYFRYAACSAWSAQWMVTGSGHGSSTKSLSENIPLTGSSASANNMPPYTVAYCWRRTA